MFLRARLDEDEAAARRVDSSWRQIGNTGVIVASDGERAEECANGNWAGIADHIARHDPARVLREVEAKRLLIANYEEAVAFYDEPANRRVSAGEVTGLSTALACAALPYIDHPDFKETWCP